MAFLTFTLLNTSLAVSSSISSNTTPRHYFNYVSVHSHANTHTHTHTHARMHTHTHTHTHAHTYTHTHMTYLYWRARSWYSCCSIGVVSLEATSMTSLAFSCRILAITDCSSPFSASLGYSWLECLPHKNKPFLFADVLKILFYMTNTKQKVHIPTTLSSCKCELEHYWKCSWTFLLGLRHHFWKCRWALLLGSKTSLLKMWALLLGSKTSFLKM